jgi:hypothetical protein
MAREKKETLVELTPKSEAGKKRMSYHGSRWVFKREIDTLGGMKLPGPWIGVQSRDGKTFLWIHKVDDADFTVREVG